MSDLTELYQQMILDHGRHPRNFGKIEVPDCCQEGFNPLCGDRLLLYVSLNEGVIDAIKFEGEGCAISLASASLMSEYLKGMCITDAEQLFESFQDMVTGNVKDEVDLGKLSVLSGVSAFPSRVKCATLCWHTLLSALQGNKKTVSKE